MDEPPHPLTVLPAWPILQGTRRVHPVGLEELDRFPHVLRAQPSGDDDVITSGGGLRHLPVEPLARTSPRPLAVRVEQDQVSPVSVQRPEGGGALYAQCFYDFDATLPYGGYGLGRLVAVELREVEPDLAGDR